MMRPIVFKNFNLFKGYCIDKKSLALLYEERPKKYTIMANDIGIMMAVVVDRPSPGATSFDNNYKAQACRIN